ncbi:hypothetical protein [Streptomyces varsoviensis]|uniref:hypothetical protein n=1 Tax=Streptomyces varsoviensis TaxID=67373 RepID=UPI0006624B57|nr:hypothetical protein [Streptomyces varsoviensis]
MTDPITSKYDTTPLPDGDGDDKPSPDHNKNLDGLVPTDKVAWTAPPSFNDDPKDIGSDSGSALLNHSGQVYGHTDRKSNFPAPPSK